MIKRYSSVDHFHKLNDLLNRDFKKSEQSANNSERNDENRLIEMDYNFSP